MPPLPAAVPSVHGLMDHLTVRLGTYHYVVDLVDAFFSIGIAPESPEQFAFTWDRRQWTFGVLPRGYLHSPTICHGLVAQDLAQWDHPSSVTLFRYVDEVLLTSDSLSDLEQAAPSLLCHLKSCGWVVNEEKVRGPGLSVKFLGVIWLGNDEADDLAWIWWLEWAPATDVAHWLHRKLQPAGSRTMWQVPVGSYSSGLGPHLRRVANVSSCWVCTVSGQHRGGAAVVYPSSYRRTLDLVARMKPSTGGPRQRCQSEWANKPVRSPEAVQCRGNRPSGSLAGHPGN